MKKKEVKACYFRLPANLKQRLDKLSKKSAKPKSKLIIEALEAYFENYDSDGEDFSFAIDALEELKDGNYDKASKKIDKAVKKLQK
ncbi:ribbon-helix-helix domain-containing protein [Campylobacter sp. MIT 97-5078]|uniref:ribbon-helix-helix domain-containing protein n=1 Tax=Campylobacter sp. MIT 97-5078 TaxID=1548153 RepID=UPI000514823D|nr:ribbon-helix-helix domain-containing protein [Campylobacter sp. MIT 97-5078]KGI55409.1 CopG family transcriptional regulator [Campylobacter sp. MIT 97-5078]KGI55634.1 CopG family transcriptional regulator [Campylobacter sp. MIT 97-5078]KGI57410.1 CopG family transcriptional regulator [Campylobacter sp. MIT 97-5078]KGI57413.1 CopG family transcriptional regulator [Campylobacter sp. MIT 97-5078]TQR26686.1 ribbon-helix-helix domain-containing protein [Campylobacter sp. MIT 97-5078]